MTTANETDVTAASQSGDPPDRDRLRALARLLRGLHQAKATGELADLRRMDRTRQPPTAFFRLMARAGFSEMSAPAVRRWTAAVQVMALRPDALRTDLPLGDALVRIGVSEQRLDMLLNARGDTLFDVVRRLSLRLARSDVAMPYRELCRLLVWSDRAEHDEHAEKLRLAIAQSFVRAAGRSSANAESDSAD